MPAALAAVPATTTSASDEHRTGRTPAPGVAAPVAAPAAHRARPVAAAPTARPGQRDGGEAAHRPRLVGRHAGRPQVEEQRDHHRPQAGDHRRIRAA